MDCFWWVDYQKQFAKKGDEASEGSCNMIESLHHHHHQIHLRIVMVCEIELTLPNIKFTNACCCCSSFISPAASQPFNLFFVA